jgi:hypothetical protein
MRIALGSLVSFKPCAVLFVGLLPLVAAEQPELLESGLAPEAVENRRYLDYARECIDLLLRHGTDRYGKVQAPILVSTLDVRTRTCPQEPLPLDEAVRVIRRGRRAPGGNNLYLDQPTLRAMAALSRLTGDGRYAAFSRRYLAYATKHLVDSKGFLCWGWHRHYDAYRDEMSGHAGNWHEIHVQQPVWEQLWDVDSKAVVREVEAIWKWHIIDKATGECNRHGDGQRGCDFAMSAGEFIAAFAFLHGKTGEKEWLDRARLVADYYWERRHPETDLIPNRPNAGKDRFDGSHFDTSITGLFCRSLLKASEWTREPLFRDQAVAYLKAYARRGYDEKSGKFWGALKLDGAPLEGPRLPGGYEGYQPRGPIDMWEPYVLGYEMPIYTAQAYARAYELTRDETLLEAAKRWAESIRRSFPPRHCNPTSWYRWYAESWARSGTYAGLYGRTISFFLHLHALTGDTSYRRFAREVAREALSRLYYRGLLRGHPRKPYYEAVDGVGYLLRALIQLDRALTAGSPGESGTKDIGFENW